MVTESHIKRHKVKDSNKDNIQIYQGEKSKEDPNNSFRNAKDKVRE
jgi:hypothetical protein